MECEQARDQRELCGSLLTSIVSPNVAKTEKRKKSDARVARWLEGYQKQRVLLLWLGCAGAALVSIPVLFVTWWVIWFVLLFAFRAVIPGGFLSAVTWFVWLLLFVAHVTANRQHLENFKFESEGKLVAARYAAYVSGMSSLALLAGPETMHSFVKFISLTLLFGPALIGLSWRLGKGAIAAQKMDVSLVASALRELLTADRRYPVDDLAAKVNAPDPPRLLRELLLIDGVILLNSDDPSLTVTDSLIKEVSAGIERLESEEA